MAGAHDSPLAPSSLAAFARNEDGSAKDPAAFREALLKDPERIKALQVSPDDLLTSSSLLRMAVETRDKPCPRRSDDRATAAGCGRRLRRTARSEPFQLTARV